MNVTSAITNTISIALFNRGLADKIFDDVKRNGPKVVMKDNVAECVLLSPDEYIALMDEVNDARLLMLTNSRIAHVDIAAAIPAEDVYRDLGISTEDLVDANGVEIE